MTTMEEIFGEPIDVHTRAQALADGALVEVPAGIARESRFVVPIALTAAAWSDCVAWGDADTERTGLIQDQTGRLRDVLTMAHLAVRRATGPAVVFTVARLPREPQPLAEDGPEAEEVQLVMHTRPGDQGEQVITIMLPGED